jgi:hypothetical protein
MSNIIDQSAFKGVRSPKRVLHSENDEIIEPRVKVRRRSGRSMHTFVFRSYTLIVESAEADLMRDVCFDMHKAQVNSRLSGGKLQPIASRPRWRKTAYLSGKQTECGDCRGSATYRGEGRAVAHEATGRPAQPRAAFSCPPGSRWLALSF